MAHINTDRAFICLAISEREATIAEGRRQIAEGVVSAADMPVALAFIANLEAANARVRANYGIGKVAKLARHPDSRAGA